jgi:hypothetical protein
LFSGNVHTRLPPDPLERGAVPLDAARASDREVNTAFRDKPEVKSRLEGDTGAKAAYARARELAEGAPARVR